VKERLTGAIILVALIVLLVPELLTGPIRKSPAPAASPAAHAEPPLRSYTLTLSGEPQAPASDIAPAAQAPASSRKAPPQLAEEHSPAPAPAAPHEAAATLPQHGAQTEPARLQAAKSAAHQVVQETRSSGSAGGWVVQLGSFASRQNADRLARSLRAKGFRTTVSPGRAGSRVLWRVRAGPTRDRAGALHLAARLKALGHRGELIPLR
jgi:DedD protein